MLAILCVRLRRPSARSRWWLVAVLVGFVYCGSAKTQAEPATLYNEWHRSQQPHPAVARIIVPEGEATSYGSGTLVDIRDDFGLVITNWHVVRDAKGPIEVLFPDGYHSKARSLKIDADWDLAALVVWRPKAPPVTVTEHAPRPGETLTICGYGHGIYRSATGKCTQYYAPEINLPRHMVELDVQARQGDSGGPIFNERGELAGVLFGAGKGTTLGSFGGRVSHFLATLAPDIGKNELEIVAEAAPPDKTEPQKSAVASSAKGDGLDPSATLQANSHDTELEGPRTLDDPQWRPGDENIAALWGKAPSSVAKQQVMAADSSVNQPIRRRTRLFDNLKSALAVIGVLAVAVQILRAAK
ncbi:S1 family peptidase [Adhaeretor mobilis]|nr:serine protease [Adhaeretor mobilis]